jgi:pimeloyl-ACP methyl ester carboxylesterase
MKQLLELASACLVYEVQGQGYPLVLVHGHPFNRSMWAAQVAGLSAAYQVISFDLRGYGESTSTLNYVSLNLFAQDIEALRLALGLREFVLAGLSMGGQIALEYYRCYPERVRALLLLDTFATLDSEAGQELRRTTAKRLESEGMAPYATEVLPRMISSVTLFQQPAVATAVLQMMQATSPKGAAAALRGRADRQDYTGLLSTIRVPTLVLVGLEDAYTPVSDAVFMQQHIPKARLSILPGVGHLPPMEAPGECTRVMENFLKAALTDSELHDDELGMVDDSHNSGMWRDNVD